MRVGRVPVEADHGARRAPSARPASARGSAPARRARARARQRRTWRARPSSGGLWRRVMTRPAAPNTAAERRMAPTLCGSVTWSSTMMGRPAPISTSSSSVGSGSGSVSISAPWCTVSAPSRRSRSFGSTALVRQLPGGERLLQAALGVVRQIELGDGAAWDCRAPPRPRGCRRSASAAVSVASPCAGARSCGRWWWRSRMGWLRTRLGGGCISRIWQARPCRFAVDRE